MTCRKSSKSRGGQKRKAVHVEVILGVDGEHLESVCFFCSSCIFLKFIVWFILYSISDFH